MNEEVQKALVTDTVNALRCRYAQGPIQANGEPEFGWRDMSSTITPSHPIPSPVMLRAAVLLEETEEERLRLKTAIVTHRAQSADDRCIEDDDRLYEAVGDGIKCDRRVGCQLDMITNCVRFVKNRTEGGGWKSYVELEEENKRLFAAHVELTAASARLLEENKKLREDLDHGGKTEANLATQIEKLTEKNKKLSAELSQYDIPAMPR